MTAELPLADATLVAEVLIPVAVDQAYTYLAGDLVLQPGDVVEVPLGPRTTIGVVWSVGPLSGDRPRLKPVAARTDLPPLSKSLRDFVDWVARWTVSPRGTVLRMALRAPFVGEPAAPRSGVVATGAAPAKPTPARLRVMEAVAAEPLLGKTALATSAGCTVAVVNALLSDGALAMAEIPPEPAVAPADPDHARPQLSSRQAEAAAALVEAVEARRSGVILLEGVTGSGKTEVYFEAVAAAIRAGRQALVLLPEIALTATFLERFAARFGARPAEWHSSMGARRRHLVWHALARGEAQVVIGARSALFLPFRDLGVVIVDEEHEAAYKQEDGVPYHARDMAVVRGRSEGAPVVLASATPSIETQTNARNGRYGHLVLPGRYGERALPSLAALDLKRDPPARGHWIAPGLEHAIRETVGRGEQALLFLNRRGYAPLTLCRVLRAPLPVPELLLLAGRAPLPPPARLPPLRPRRAAAGGMPGLRGDARADPLRPRHRAARRRGRRALPRCAHAGAVVRLPRRRRRAARRVRRGGGGALRHRRGHAARRQGP